MSFEAAFRRAPRPGEAPEPGSDPALVGRIRAEIERHGPITFARFMELALYDPERGYYRGGTPRAGREGDFLTAPEAHPIFGWAIARQVVELWRALGEPEPFTIREHGAGSGALAGALLAGLVRDAPALGATVRYEPVDVEPRRIAALRERLVAQGAADRLADATDDPITGIVVANELLDALPVHRIVKRGHELRELHVGWDGAGFVDVETEPSTPELGARLDAEGIRLADGQAAEVCLAIDAWIGRAAAGLDRGMLLLIDYGAAAADLYDPARRPRGTLAAYVGHTVHGDPFRNVGRQDLTAHVDLTAVERAATAAGLVPLGSTTQAEFLVALGIGDLLGTIQADARTTLADYVELRSALLRLLDPAASGAFRVVAFGRGLPAGAAFRGFGFRLARPE